MSEGTFDAVDGDLVLPDSIEREIKSSQAFVQLIDSSGTELLSYNRPKMIPTKYSVPELALRTLYSERYGYHVRSSFDKQMKPNMDRWTTKRKGSRYRPKGMVT